MLRHACPDELIKLPKSGVISIRKLFPTWDSVTIDFLNHCLRMAPDLRSTSSALLQHPLFTQDDFVDKFLVHLRNIIAKESATNPLMTNRLVERKPTEFEPFSRQLCCGISGYSRLSFVFCYYLKHELINKLVDTQLHKLLYFKFI